MGLLEKELKSDSRPLIVDFAPFKIENREFWLSLDKKVKKEIIKDAETTEKEGFPPLPLSLYRDFSISGNRKRFEDIFFSKRRNLSRLVLGECVLNNSKFITAIEDGIWSLLSEPSWVVPAHNQYIRDTKQLDTPLLERPILDLFACETGEVLALSKVLLESKLSPILVSDINLVLYQRITKPYIEDHFWWMGGMGSLNNWSPWCTQNVLLSSLTNPLLDQKTRTKVAISSVKTLDEFVWMFSSSLKLSSEVFDYPIRWIPEKFHWENYKVIWEKINLATYTKNSFKLSIIITLIQLLTSSFAAYGFSKCQFPGRNALFLAYVATIAIPWQCYMLPQYIMMQKMHLIDTHLAIILLQSFTAFGVFLLRQFYITIPDELLEAARIDGLSEYGTFARVVLPLTKPAMATLIIMSFVTVWNDYMGPMIYFTSDKNKTIQLGIQLFVGQYSAEYGLIMATSVLALIPVLVVFLAFQRFFVEGIASSGLKG